MLLPKCDLRAGPHKQPFFYGRPTPNCTVATRVRPGRRPCLRSRPPAWTALSLPDTAFTEASEMLKCKDGARMVQG